MPYDLMNSDRLSRAANRRSRLGLAGLLRASAATAALLGAPALAHADPAAFTPPAGVTAYRLMFVTADTTNPDSSEAADYNSFVTTEAAKNTALPATTWSALVSTPDVDAVSNISCGAECDANVPIYLVDGSTLVATSADAMFAGMFSAPPDEDQYGNYTLASVWTGSNPDGTDDAGSDMGATSPPGFISIGAAGEADSDAISYGSDFYLVSNPVYAVSAEITVPEPPAGAALLLGGLVVTGIYRRRRSRG